MPSTGRLLLHLTLSNISLWGYHGTETEEKTSGGPFRLSIRVDCLATPDPEEDQLANRLDYASLANRAAQIFAEKRFDLIEPLTERIARILLDEYPEIISVSLLLRKLRPVMKTELDYVEVSIERRR